VCVCVYVCMYVCVCVVCVCVYMLVCCTCRTTGYIYILLLTSCDLFLRPWAVDPGDRSKDVSECISNINGKSVDRQDDSGV
jgi:hypothetical protein